MDVLRLHCEQRINRRLELHRAAGRIDWRFYRDDGTHWHLTQCVSMKAEDAYTLPEFLEGLPRYPEGKRTGLPASPWNIVYKKEWGKLVIVLCDTMDTEHELELSDLDLERLIEFLTPVVNQQTAAERSKDGPVFGL